MNNQSTITEEEKNMNPFQKVAAAAFAALGLTSLNVSAAVDSAAPVVLLRTSCNDGSGGTLNNCFTDIEGVTDWIRNTRMPNSSTPLAVEIGPGTFFSVDLACEGTFTGYTTFRGAGRENTTIGVNSNWMPYSVQLDGCTSMKFHDITIGPFNGSLGGINWKGTGTSAWQNVEFFTNNYGWNDSGTACPTSGIRGAHYWTSSRIVSTNASIAIGAYESTCAEDWFIGSEVTIHSNKIGTKANAIRSNGPNSEIHFYGGVLRVLLTGPASTTQDIAAASAMNSGEIHIHGTGIDVISEFAKPVVALKVASGGTIHANASAYNLRTAAGGTVTRINNVGGLGHIHAPYLWEHIPDTDGDPGTVDTNFISANGADQTTVTAGTSDGHPHTAVYSSACPSNARWYDQVDKVCRGQ